MRYSNLSINLSLLASAVVIALSAPTLAQQVVNVASVSCGPNKEAPVIGQRCGDVIYAGASDGSRVYVEAQPRAALLLWEDATAACTALGPEWRLPTRGELKVLFDNRDAGALAGTFDAGWHWSSTQVDGLFTPWVRNLATGERGTASAGNAFAARCVRAEGRLSDVRTNEGF